MPAVVFWIVAEIIVIGTTIYKVAKWVYELIVKPVTKVIEIVNNVRDIVKGVVEFLQEKIDYVLDITGADIFLDLVHGVSEFVKLAQDIADGKKEALITVLGDLYTSIAGMGEDIIHIISDTLIPITDRIKVLQDDIKQISEFKIADLWKAFESLGEQIKQMNADLIRGFEDSLQEEVAFLKSDMSERVRTLEGEIGKVRYLTKDLKTFMEMFTKAMEV